MPTSLVSDGTVKRVEPYLEADNIAAGYGAALIVDGASISVGRGEIATIVGPNGSGKSTLLKAITGDLPARDGTVRLGGKIITNKRRDQLVRLGLRLVPQENVVFNSLSVRENLEMGGYLLNRRQVGPAIDRVLDIFPALRSLQKSVAGRLSGGERKLVAIGRVLMSEPDIVILDEPSASLSPLVSEALLAEHVPALARSGAAVLLVEQRAVQALRASDWAYVMVAGQIALSAPAADVLARGDIGELFLGRRVGDKDLAGPKPSSRSTGEKARCDTSTPEKLRISLPDAPSPFSHYCDVVRAGDLVFVSGQVALDAAQNVLSPDDPTGQARLALENVGRALAAAGAGVEDVVSVSNYVTDIKDREAVNIARKEFFGPVLPASFICEVPRLVLDGLRYEVSAVAVIGGEKLRISLPDAPSPFSHYCDVVRAGDLVFVSGQVALDAAQNVLSPDDPTGQARLALENVGRALAAAGAGVEDVVSVSNYVTDIKDREAVNIARKEFFGPVLPASFICEVPRLVLDGLRYEVSAVAVIGGEKLRISLPDAPSPFSHYCDVVRAGDLVFVSGQVALDAAQNVLSPDDPTGQARLALENVGRALAAAGAGVEDVVSVSNYVTDIKDREAVNIARKEFFGPVLPASFICEVPRLVLDGLRYEVSAVAVIGGSRR